MSRANVIQKQEYWDVLEEIAIENFADLEYLLKKKVIVGGDMVHPSGKFTIRGLVNIIETTNMKDVVYFKDSHYSVMIGTDKVNMGKYSRTLYITLIMCDGKMNLEQRKLWIEFAQKAIPDECDLCCNKEDLNLINKGELYFDFDGDNKSPFKTIEEANKALVGPEYKMEGMESTILPEGMRLWWD